MPVSMIDFESGAYALSNPMSENKTWQQIIDERKMQLVNIYSVLPAEEYYK